MNASRYEKVVSNSILPSNALLVNQLDVQILNGRLHGRRVIQADNYRFFDFDDDFDDLFSPEAAGLEAGLSDFSGLVAEGFSFEEVPSFFDDASEDSDLAESTPFL